MLPTSLFKAAYKLCVFFPPFDLDDGISDCSHLILRCLLLIGIVLSCGKTYEVNGVLAGRVRNKCMLYMLHRP